MFVLTIIPLHLSFDSDGVEANKSNDIDVAEHNVMAIEALLTSIDLNQYLPGDTFVMNTTDPNIISQNLEQTRQKELDSINSTWIASNNDSQARLDTILRTKNAVEQRLQDLQALSKALEGGTRLNYIVSGVDNTNINSVSNELNRVTRKVRAGRGKLRGRKYKVNKSLLIVVSDKCNLINSANNLLGIDIVKVNSLNAELLAPGAVPGRLTIFTEKAIEKMEKEKLFM